MKSFLYCLIAAGLLTIFCNDGSDTGNSPPVTTTPTESFGAMTVTMDCDHSSTGAVGKYYDGPNPQPKVWDVVMTDGDCKLIVPRTFTCDPPCTSGTACVEGDTCMSYPNPVDAGTITLSGVKTKEGATTVTMKAVGTAKIYSPAEEIEFLAFAEGGTVSVHSTGTALLPSFSMSVPAISKINVLNNGINLVRGQPINLRWEPPVTPGNSMIHVLIDITYHGGTKAEIEAETPDDGSLDIGAPILDKLQDYGLSGYPKIEITRHIQAMDAVTKMKLNVESFVSYELLIDGLHSCDDFTDCPAGMGFTSCSAAKCQ